MPTVLVNYWAVLVAAVASMAIGYIWYGPLFGKMWMSLSGKTEQSLAEAKARGMGKLYLMGYIGALVMAYVLQHALVFASAYLHSTGVSAGLAVGFWSWLGFIAPVTMGAVLWDGKPMKLWVLTNGYQLLSLLVMGVILAVWK